MIEEKIRGIQGPSGSFGGSEKKVKFDGSVRAKGCEAFLAYIGVSDSEGYSVKGIRTVKDFPDVFPDELPGLPPSREVEFGIELLPGIAPVSISPYRMAPKEMVELKAQIQELLDQGFIRPSVSPWEVSSRSEGVLVIFSCQNRFLITRFKVPWIMQLFSKRGCGQPSINIIDELNFIRGLRQSVVAVLFGTKY
ncbi:uncharacterized protein LOC108451474 [Gossypium arboreum]|uniref:uncharacterized protein LOC108451474 n=1 Tax=Gossypium arboreum TaxID=29729 RepID=UPI00081905C1|nr:uncharacterized protein LOC108451474 [Gossypium arboreum]